MEDLKRGYKRIEELNIDEIVPNEWNANEQDEKTFDLLCQKIKENGFLEPIGVVEVKDNSNYKYKIISGEHRYRACKILGFTKIPSVIYEDFDEDKQKFISLQVQIIHGSLNPMKLSALLTKYAEKYDQETLAQLVGFTDKDKLKVIYNQVRSELPDQIREKLDSAKNEIKTVDDLSRILNELFNTYGATVPYHFMFFAFGGKQHVMIQADKKLFDEIKELLKVSSQAKVNAGEVILKLIEGWKNKSDLF